VKEETRSAGEVKGLKPQKNQFDLKATFLIFILMLSFQFSFSQGKSIKPKALIDKWWYAANDPFYWPVSYERNLKRTEPFLRFTLKRIQLKGVILEDGNLVMIQFIFRLFVMKVKMKRSSCSEVLLNY